MNFKEAGNVNDENMFYNLEFLREYYPNQKIILFGSTTHFYKDAKSIDGVFFQNDRMCFGEYLNKSFDDKYFFIAYSAFSGTRKGVFMDRKIKEPKSNTVESKVQFYNPIVVGERNQLLNFSILLNYPTVSFTDKIECRIMGHSYQNMQLEKVCDAIIFLENCEPYTEIEN